MKPSDLVGALEEDKTLTLYWLADQSLQHKTLPNEDNIIAASISELLNNPIRLSNHPGMINALVNRYGCSTSDSNLPSPPLPSPPIFTSDSNLPSPPIFRHFHALQLGYVYNQYHLSPSLRQTIEAIAQEMIEFVERWKRKIDDQ